MPSAKFESFLSHQAQSRIVAEPELYYIAIISLSYPYLTSFISLSYPYQIPIISLSNPFHIPILNQPSSLQLSNLMIYHIILLIFFHPEHHNESKTQKADTDYKHWRGGRGCEPSLTWMEASIRSRGFWMHSSQRFSRDPTLELTQELARLDP